MNPVTAGRPDPVRPGASRNRGLARAHRCNGFTYVFVLALVAALSVGLAVAGTVWQTEVRRERERELLFVGQQYRDALNRYARESPAGTPRHPEKLEELLVDRRSAAIRRHLRRPYVDPMTGKGDWGLIRQNGRIVGVYSKGAGVPLLATGFPKELGGFEKASSYAEWTFVADGVQAGATTLASGRPASVPASGPSAPAPAGTRPEAGQPVVEPSIPNPPTPCLAAFDSAVAQCWSDANSVAQNAACEARAQRAYDACEQQRLYGGR